MSAQVENCAIEDNDYSPLFTTYINFNIEEKTTDSRIKDFLLTSSNNNLYEKLVSFGEKNYSLNFYMINSNEISGLSYYFGGSNFFNIGFNSSYNYFSTGSTY